jgi:glycosyltransferase involved in cell wall biosynthesis
MTTSTEPSTFGRLGDAAARSRWREQQAREQQAALAPGAATVTCSAPRGSGGLGRHLQEIVDALARSGQDGHCISGDRSAGGAPNTAETLAARLLKLPVPLAPGVRVRAAAAEFDAYASRRLPAAEQLIAFNGQALHQFGAAGRAGYASVNLVSANSHMRQVVRQHERAHKLYPLEGPWSSHLLARNLREYERADRVYVASRYIRESFLQQGYPEERLVSFPLTPHPRFDDVRAAARSDRFEIVYVGSLAVHKGVPLLIDAVRRLQFADLRLTLVGGWGTRGMRKFVQRACAADPRIVAGPGDPLLHFSRASVCVHPAFEDGFAYAPAEALAAGVPTIVSEDTGMMDLIDAPHTGLVLATGDLDALVQAIEAAYRGELFAGR